MNQTLKRASVIAAVWASLVAGTGHADPEPAAFQVFLDPAGSDTNSGLSPTPMKTLARAQDVLRAAQPHSDVEIRIKQGTYTAPTTTWTFVVPGHTVNFMPIDYKYNDGIGDIAGRPVFRSDGAAGYWLKARMPDNLPQGGDGGMRFYYLRVERYSMGGIALAGRVHTDTNGLRVPADAGFNHNKVFGMELVDLGSKWAASGYGYGGVDLVNSSGNLIQNNHFVREENTGGQAALLHGVYIAHHSNDNVVRNNQFAYVSGDPVRARNDSDHNDVFGNVFERTGQKAQYSDWFCDTSTQCVSPPDHPRECASHGNLFHENNNVSGYDGGTTSNWAMIVGDLNYSGAAPCTNNGEARVRTWGNT
jgi:hypothetical protein